VKPTYRTANNGLYIFHFFTQNYHSLEQTYQQTSFFFLIFITKKLAIVIFTAAREWMVEPLYLYKKSLMPT